MAPGQSTRPREVAPGAELDAVVVSAVPIASPDLNLNFGDVRDLFVTDIISIKFSSEHQLSYSTEKSKK